MKPVVLLVLFCIGCTGDSGAPHLARGNVLINNGKREEAAAEYREAARLMPRSQQARERLGDVLYDLGKLDEALAAYRDAYSVDSTAVTPRIGAARVLTDKGDFASARAELTAANERAPTHLFVLLSRGNLASRMGDKKAALADYEKAVHLKSDNVAALYQYGLALLDDGQVPEAGRTFDRIVQRAPASPTGWFGRAKLAAHEGQAAAAGSALAEARKRVADDARRGLAEQGLAGEGLDQRAAEAAKRSLESMERDPAFARFAADAAFRAALR